MSISDSLACGLELFEHSCSESRKMLISVALRKRTSKLLGSTLGICAALLCAANATAQTTVTTGGGASGAIPYFSTSSDIESSVIYQSNGNIGIGTSGPGYLLDVGGDLNFSGILRYQGTPMILVVPVNGVGANPDGEDYYLAHAGNSSVAQGCCNVGIGANALLNNAAGGQFNVAVGANALSQNTSGGYNVAVGGQALQNNTTGTYNMALGGLSLLENTTGQSNSAVGAGALNQNTTGNNNTAVGQDALLYNTTGGQNTAVGTWAMFSNTTGYSNDVLGAFALMSNETGIDNIAFGDGAGDDACTNPTFAYLNGPVASCGGSAYNTSANQNVYLGASTMSLTSGDTNEIVIGAYAVGNGNNTVTLGNSSIASTILRGNILMTNGTVNSGASITFPDTTVQSTAWNGVLSGGDYAESVNVSGDREEYEPGDVMVIDPASEGNFLKSATPYSTAVTGIYSTKPGVVGRRQLTARAHMKEEVPMAMTGIVPTKVSAENGPIKPGDLLVTSSKPGYAMKGTDRTQMLGAVIGKAIGHLDAGVGIIEAVVTLQ
jgi:hypothetical protein